MSRQAQMLAAIAAISEGRFEDAVDVCELLIENAPRPQRGRCRFCGCSERQACGIVILGVHHEPVLVKCSWIDLEQTVCSRATCVTRYEAEQQEAAALREPPLIVTP